MKKIYKRSDCLWYRIRCATLVSAMSMIAAGAFASNVFQWRNIQISAKKTSLSEVLKTVEKEANCKVIYVNSAVESYSNITIEMKNASVEEVLKKVLENTDLVYSIKNEVVTIYRRDAQPQVTETTQQKREIRGVVVDKSTKQPIAGATVIIVGTTDGAITDERGNFTIKTLNGSQVEVSFTGMKKQVIAVTPNLKQLNVSMEASALEVEDVVVTGYFNRSKDSYTGNATTFTGGELRQMSSGNILNSLSMIDPSFKMVVNNEFGSDPNRIPEFTVQGASNLQNEYSNTPNMPTFILDGFEVSSQKVFDLDPNRVKSITILKDAAATAIYGSRADNGVVVVETIAPAEGQIRLSYTFNGDFNVADLSSYNLMNAAEKLEFERAAGLFDHRYPSVMESLDDIYNTRLGYVEKGIDTDWIKKPVQSIGFGHKHSIIVDGGNQNLRYSFDVNYRGNNGIMKESGRDNIGVGAKLQYIYKKFKFSNDMTFNNTKSFNSSYGVFSEYTRLNPYYHPYDANGNVVYMLQKGINSSDVNVYNPMFNATINTKDETSLNNFTERFSMEWNAAKGLKLKANASIESGSSRSDIFKPNRHTSFSEATEYKGRYDKSTSNDLTYDINASASYMLQMDRHLINIIGIYNVRESNSDVYSISAYNFPNDNFDHISMATTFKEGDRPTGFQDISRLMGVAFNGNYSYDNRFLVDISVRSDASSVFGSNKRWGTFYAVGVGWNIHKEKWFVDNDAVNNLKLRASQGTTGGQNFYPYQAMKMFTYKDVDIDGTTYGGEIGALLMAYGNPDLKWQTTKKFNVGLDFSLLNNRLSGYVNWYSNLTKDKLIDFTLAPSTGFSTFTSNLGNVLNKGWEVNFKGTIIRNTKNNLRWDVFVNFVSNKNELRNINNALTTFNNSQNDKIDVNDAKSPNKPLVKYIEGMSVNMLWANKSIGIDPSTGEEVFLDRDGNRTNVYDVKNDQPLVCADPKFEGNFGTMVTYKGLSFSAYFAYSHGGYVYNQTLVDKIENVNPQFNGDKRILYNRWKQVGNVAQFKDIKNTTRTYPTSRFIEKDNYLRLSSVSVSYQLSPQRLKSWGIEMLKVSAIGNDIFRASTVRMERGISYPFARTFSLSLQATF